MSRACVDIEHTAGQVYNVGGGPGNTISVWTELREPLERLVEPLPTVNYGEFRHGDQRIYVSDIRKARQDMNWMPRVGIEDGLRLMVEAWRKNRETANAG
jgi:CDP-paratose 2-epimerase